MLYHGLGEEQSSLGGLVKTRAGRSRDTGSELVRSRRNALGDKQARATSWTNSEAHSVRKGNESRTSTTPV